MATNITIREISEWLNSLASVTNENDIDDVYVLGRDASGNMVRISAALLRGGEEPADTRGWWIHKDTKEKSYFDSSASFISNGIMSRPTWIADAEEIRLCAGITGFTTSAYPIYGFDACNVFNYEDKENDGNHFVNRVLKVLDFGDADIANVPNGLIGLNGGTFDTLRFNSKVRTLGLWTIYGWLENFPIGTVKVVFPYLPESMGAIWWGSPVAAFDNFIYYEPENAGSFIFYTNSGDITNLNTMLDTTYGTNGSYSVADIDTLT